MQLPDYHEVIAHPMDFGTARKKLSNGAYANLEQFEVGLCACDCYLLKTWSFVTFPFSFKVSMFISTV